MSSWPRSAAANDDAEPQRRPSASTVEPPYGECLPTSVIHRARQISRSAKTASIRVGAVRPTPGWRASLASVPKRIKYIRALLQTLRLIEVEPRRDPRRTDKVIPLRTLAELARETGTLNYQKTLQPIDNPFGTRLSPKS